MALSSCQLMEARMRAVIPSPWLLLLLCVAATGGVLRAVAQPGSGFVTIDCGLPGETGYVDTNTMVQYTTDAGFTDTGINGNISSKYTGLYTSRYTVRSFPIGIRNCYIIGSLKAGLKYLIRAKFLYGNYDGLDRLPILFDLYIGVNLWTTVNISCADFTFTMEAIMVVPDNFVQVCLVNTGFGTPFINGLDLRPLKDTFYPHANETQGLFLVQRFNFGPSDPNTFFRYLADPQDRWWWPFVNATADWTEIKMSLEVEKSVTYATPTAVMQTAITPRSAGRSNIEFSLDLPSPLNHMPLSYISIMHFSELKLHPRNASQQYDIVVNGEPWYQAFKPSYLKSGYVDSKRSTEYSQYHVSINALANSTLPPIINAFELFSVMSTTNLGTDAQDASAITAIKKTYQVHKNWMGDPCSPNSLAWVGLNCSYAISNHPIITCV